MSDQRNPDNGCEIQYACDGRSKVMIRLKLVKGSVDNELLANGDPGGLRGTRVMLSSANDDSTMQAVLKH